jgi:hypothetical protein
MSTQGYKCFCFQFLSSASFPPTHPWYFTYSERSVVLRMCLDFKIASEHAFKCSMRKQAQHIPNNVFSTTGLHQKLSQIMKWLSIVSLTTCSQSSQLFVHILLSHLTRDTYRSFYRARCIGLCVRRAQCDPDHGISDSNLHSIILKQRDVNSSASHQVFEPRRLNKQPFEFDTNTKKGWCAWINWWMQIDNVQFKIHIVCVTVIMYLVLFWRKYNIF